MGPLLQFVTEYLSLPVFASGRTAIAYDEIFGKTGQEVDVERMKKAIARSMVGKNYPEDILSKFIDYVAYQPRLYAFGKVKFVAAINHLIIGLKPNITKHFQDAMPGMANYTHGGGVAGAPPNMGAAGAMSPYQPMPGQQPIMSPAVMPNMSPLAGGMPQQFGNPYE